ncbi:hypothetical protein Q7P37_009155 [Cladosporium fusiforme]
MWREVQGLCVRSSGCGESRSGRLAEAASLLAAKQECADVAVVGLGRRGEGLMVSAIAVILYIHTNTYFLPISSSILASIAPLLRQVRCSRFRPALHAVKLAPRERLSLISRHLNTNAHVPLNTPFSIERNSSPNDDLEHSKPKKPQSRQFGTQTTPPPEEEAVQEKEEEPPVTMSAQPEHPTVLIPGPIEYDDEVLKAMSHYSEPHTAPGFVNIFGETLSMLRKLFQTTNPNSQPFVISGSGTLGWDQAAVNLVEQGDEVLVLHTGYFADSFADCFEAYGAKATQLKAAIGDRPQLDEIEKALKEKEYKMLTVTHTDTSTGVLSDIKAVSELVHRVSPNTLVVVDGVCSVACEDIRFDDWGLDVVLTATQKAIGVPAGLSILMASERAIERFRARSTPPASYYISWKNWLPIMQNYEAKKPSYFATPSPQLVHALHTSLTQILSVPLEDRFRMHKEASQKVKNAVAELGLKQIPTKPENAANGMTAIYLPEGLTPPEILPKLASRGIIFAGGLHKEIAAKYIRFGHMGVSVTDPKRGDLDKAIKALKEGLAEIIQK